MRKLLSILSWLIDGPGPVMVGLIGVGASWWILPVRLDAAPEIYGVSILAGIVGVIVGNYAQNRLPTRTRHLILFLGGALFGWIVLLAWYRGYVDEPFASEKYWGTIRAYCEALAIGALSFVAGGFAEMFVSRTVIGGVVLRWLEKKIQEHE